MTNQPTEPPADKLRVAVCEAIGWKRGDIRRSPFIIVEGWISPDGDEWQDLPPLTLDLMHEAEKTLNDDETDDYSGVLWDVCQLTKTRRWHATAEQRARAFCKVKDL